MTSSLKQISYDIMQRYDIEQLGMDLNHIHLLVSFHPKYSIGQFVRIYKSITAKQLFLSHPALRKSLWGGEFWSDGYYVSTVSEHANWNTVKNYVKSQGIPPTQLTLF
ncbi:MAG: IS200/IS605 family transposase [bacterium]